MRFFTAEWHRRAESAPHDSAAAREAAQVVADYERHLAALRPALPATLRVLAELVLHGARIRRVVLDRAGRELRLELRGGDERLGWYDLDLTYLGAVLDAADAAVLREAARDEATVVVHDEVDLATEGHFLHRLLFAPWRDGEIMFRALALRMAPRANAEVPAFADRWVEVG